MSDAFSNPQTDVNPEKETKLYDGPVRIAGSAIWSLVFGLGSILFACLSGTLGLIFGVVALRKIAAGNGRFRGKTLAIAGIITSILFSIIWLGIALPTAWFVREVARDRSSHNNIRMLAIASVNHESAFRKLPTDFYDRETGKPLLSWRVNVLPYLENSNLHDKFRMDEPWDSPHNLELAKKNMPVILKRPGLNLPPGMTVYKRVVGNGALFNEPDPDSKYGERGTRFADVRDGTTNTIMLVECDPSEAVFWTQPQTDHRFNPDDPAQGLGAGRFSNLIFAMASGESAVVPAGGMTTEQLRSAFTRSGGEKFRFKAEVFPNAK